ncbi:Zn(II)2Cys6 transcription factor [Aspergillus homomorphus CBS 101889]|uniref:Zn(II)2Cys6 transcription factor n=1 Tax=Aspergillus homomorphus (strain CBS 101889) TaxID=1450537 RepID=A0A395I4A2_ASPHC|nr:Zn(II)2Cys6 transcription factor [Aspergillus homomorphus CBS 101889]RAL14595.1 Zn(II)2Cys6 transcription factor [Aspergillus homomorphus CBS 101889]
MEAPQARGMGRSGPRRRTGCLTCRARKVRCDEVKPTCANCTRLRLQCAYKTIVPAHAPRTDCQSQAASSATVAAPPSDRPDVNFFHTVLCEDRLPASSPLQQPAGALARPPPTLTVDSTSFDVLSLIEEITSDFQQKHPNLTTNGSNNVLGEAGPANVTTETASHDGEVMNWVSVEDRSAAPISLGAHSDQADTNAPDPGQTAYEAQLFTHFLASGPPPTIFGPVDLDWKYVRTQMVRQSRRCRAVLLGIYCYSEVHQAWVEGKSWNRKSKYHQLACSEIQPYLHGVVENSVLKQIFTTVLLLMLSELLSSPNLLSAGTPSLHSTYLLLQRFHHRTRAWSDASRLIVAWVSLLDVKALIAGREGDALIELGRLPSADKAGEDAAPEKSRNVRDDEDDNPEPAFLIRQVITGPAFQFHLQTQQILRRIVFIDLHHRNRGTVGDEFEVLQLAHQIGADLETLWNQRPRVLDIYSTPEELCDTLQPAVAWETCRAFRQYIANFLAIFIYLHRVAFAIYPRTDRVHRAVEGIIQLATVETQSTSEEQQHLPASFVWPLFVAGLEGSMEQRQWILLQIQQISKRGEDSDSRPRTTQHPHAEKVYLLLEEMTRRQDASRTWADSRCVRRELFTDFFVMI